MKRLHIWFEAPKYLNSHFSKCKRAFFGISNVTPCEQCTDGQMDMKVYEKLLHRQKIKSHKDSSDNNILFYISITFTSINRLKFVKIA